VVRPARKNINERLLTQSSATQANSHNSGLSLGNEMTSRNAHVMEWKNGHRVLTRSLNVNTNSAKPLITLNGSPVCVEKVEKYPLL
jgi:hypothetical protein